MNTIREIEKINQEELDRGIAGTAGSWHAQYANSAWCYVGNLDHQLTEGDLICIMSQFGEIEDIHLVREEDTGKSRGFGFIKYEDARSCVLAVDNFVGTQILGRSLRVDHVEQYRLPKKLQEQEENAKAAKAGETGHAYKGMELENQYNVNEGVDLFAPISTKTKHEDHEEEERRKRKEERKRRREEKEERKRQREAKRERKEEKKRQKRPRRYNDEVDGGSSSSGRRDNNSDNAESKSSRNDKYLSSSSISIDYYSDGSSRHRRNERGGKKEQQKFNRSDSHDDSDGGGVGDRRRHHHRHRHHLHRREDKKKKSLKKSRSHKDDSADA